MSAALSDLELLERLISFDTVSWHSNRPLADFASEYADGAGRVEQIASPDGTKTNLVIRFGPEADDRSGLVLSGHMDVVPAGEDEWESDPFTLTDGGDRSFGRGACDMKGFLALALNVAREARDLKKPLVLVYTYDEEVGTVGAHDLVDRWPGADSLPRHAIIGEPTELKVVRMHKGHLRVRVALLGVSAHSGYPHLGKSAIDLAARVLVSLRKLRHRLEQAGGPHAEFFPEVPFVPLNIGTIHGGSAVNVVPDRCVLELGVRLLPGMGKEAMLGAIRDAVRNAAGEEPHAVEVVNESPPMLLDEHADIHQALTDMTGQEHTCAVSFATDAGWLSRTGMECAIFGPGSIEVAHKPNEYVPKADLEKARGFLLDVVERFCK